MKTIDSHFVPIPTLRRDDSGIEPCQVGIPTSPDKVRIPTLSGTILELSRFLLCAEHPHLGCLISDLYLTLLLRCTRSSLFLNPFQTTNFRHFQTERVCRRRFSFVIEMTEIYPNG